MTLIVSAQFQPGDPCVIEDHENNNGSYRPHPNNCNEYLQCLHGQYVVRSCSGSLHWNADEVACDFPQQANCMTFHFEQKNEVGGACDVGDHEDNLGMYVPHPDNCALYLQCLHGFFGARPCPEGLHWNAEKTACDFPQKANCLRNVNAQLPYPVPPVPGRLV